MKFTLTQLQAFRLLLETIKDQQYAHEISENVSLVPIAERDRAYLFRDFYAEELEKGEMQEEDFAGMDRVGITDLANFFLDRILIEIDEQESDELTDIVGIGGLT